MDSVVYCFLLTTNAMAPIRDTNGLPTGLLPTGPLLNAPQRGQGASPEASPSVHGTRNGYVSYGCRCDRAQMH